MSIYMYRYVSFEHSFSINRFHIYSLNKAKLTLQPGDTFRIKVRGINLRCSFRSSNRRVAVVDMWGTVRAVSPGRTVIYIKIKGHKTKKCFVKVKKRTT